jgi:hypothetical protein
MQDRASGARASRWGHETARAIAEKLGASHMRRSSNECVLNGERVVIKCAAPTTLSIGVTYKMLDRLDRVIAAFQRDDGTFRLWTVTPAQFREAMRATRSQGAAAGKVGLVERRTVEQIGKSVGRIVIGVAG